MDISNYRIVMPKNAGTTENRAASFLQQQIRLVRGVKIPLVTDETSMQDYEFVIGRTTREIEDGIPFTRTLDGAWEYVIKTHGTRVYITSLGAIDDTVKPYRSDALMDDNAFGTAHAVYRYIEEVLGFDFSYVDWNGFPTYDELDVREYNFEFTRAEIRKQKVKEFEGSAFYSMRSQEIIDWNTNSFILKTKSGKLIVMDGGRPVDLDRLLEQLELLSHGEKPVISGWFITHLHTDHHGALKRLCEEPEMAKRVVVEAIYHCMLPEEYYKTYHDEKTNEAYHTLLNADKALGTRVVQVDTGDRFVYDEFTLDIMRVPLEKDMHNNMNMNDTSIVIKLNYTNGEQTMMFLGDADRYASDFLINNYTDEEVHCDIVQIGHHGCHSVSEECYKKIGADVYIWPTCHRNWYGDNSEGLHTRNLGIYRNRTWMMRRGVKVENVYRDTLDILSLEFPIEIK